jgi:hypothetical protein
MNNYMKRKEQLFSIIFILMTLILFFVFKPSEYKICMKAYSQMKKMQYKGIVLNSFIDSENHLLPTIIIDSGKDTITITDFRDSSGLFNYLTKGDSIFKDKNSSLVIVKRNNLINSFSITYNCPK